MNRRTTIVIVTAAFALIAFVSAGFFYQSRHNKQSVDQAVANQDAMVRMHSPVIGPVTAPVTIVEFFDPACEACRAFYPHVKRILDSHPQKARLVIRYVPFHGDISIEGVRILESAREQQMFEPVMEALLQAQPVWASHSAPSAERAWEFAHAAGLNLERARNYVASGKVDALLELDVTDLEAVGIRATPTFFVNGKPLLTPDPRILQEMVESAIAQTR